VYLLAREWLIASLRIKQQPFLNLGHASTCSKILDARPLRLLAVKGKHRMPRSATELMKKTKSGCGKSHHQEDNGQEQKAKASIWAKEAETQWHS
jgi:hypothetical protein